MFLYFGIFSVSLSLAVSQTYNIPHLQLDDQTEVTRPHQTLFLGDVMLGRLVGVKIAQSFDPFEKTRSEFEKYDELIINLEGPITKERSCQKKAYSFQFHPDVSILLKEAHITAASLANNHTNDCYQKGYDDTLKHLSSSGIQGFGQSGGVHNASYTYKTPMGTTTIVGIDNTLHTTSLSDILGKITWADENSAFVVVFVHWGDEYEQYPSRAQRDLAYKYVDNGADVIIGHHPHVIQPMESYKNSVIFYSLGNFVFDQFGDKRNRGYGVAMTMSEKEMLFEVKPYVLEGTQPQFLSEEDKVFRGMCRFVLGDYEEQSCSYSYDAF